jgi:hypothetical protein
VSLADEAWMQERFGGPAGITEVFKGPRWQDVFRIAFHQLEDQSAFAPQEVTVMNEETGASAKHMIGGYKLFFGLAVGIGDKQNVLLALLETIGFSRPIVDKIIEEEMKAAALSPEKKSDLNAGERSSTPSPANTAGP